MNAEGRPARQDGPRGSAHDHGTTDDALFHVATSYVGAYGERVIDWRVGPERVYPVPSIKTAGQNADPEWAAETWAAILDLADSGVEFSNDDVRARVTRRPHHPNAWGAAMRRAAGAGLIERAGSAPSRQQSRAGSYTSTWRGRA